MKRKQQNEQHEQTEESGMITTTEAARRLGMSDQTVRRLITTGELPAYRFGRQYRVSEVDLRAYLERTRTRP